MFESGSGEQRLDVYDRKTTVTLWGPLMRFAKFPVSSNSAVKVTLQNARSAATNSAAGCEAVSSIDLVMEPNGVATAAQKSTVTVQFWLGSSFAGIFNLPVSMHPRVPDIAWGATTALRNCLRQQNGNLTVLPGTGRTHLLVTIPRDLRVETCLGSLAIDAALVPNGFIDAGPDGLVTSASGQPARSTGTWRVDRFGPVANRTANRFSNPAECLRGDCRPQVPLLVDLDWPRLAALPHPSSIVATANVFFGEETTGGSPLDPNDPRRLQQLRVTVNTTETGSGIPVADCTATPTVASLQANGGAVVVDFDATASSDEDGTIVDVQWTFGVSDGDEGASGPTASNVYRLPGQFIATCIVTDDDGKTSSDEIEIFILP